jgi:hypothetical protein
MVHRRASVGGLFHSGRLSIYNTPEEDGKLL